MSLRLDFLARQFIAWSELRELRTYVRTILVEDLGLAIGFLKVSMFCGLCFKPPRFHFITLLLLPQQLFPQVVTNLLPFGGVVVIHHVQQLLNTWRRIFHSWRFLLTPPSFNFTLLPQLLPPRTSLRRGGLIQRCWSRTAYGSDMLELWWERSCGGFLWPGRR